MILSTSLNLIIIACLVSLIVLGRHLSSDPIFEGSFSVNGDIHHIKLSSNYRITKRSDDIDLDERHGAEPSKMIIYRDSDTEEVESLTDRSESPQLECGMDNLLFNQKTSRFGNHIKRSLTPRSYNQLSGWNDFAGVSKFDSSGFSEFFPVASLDLTDRIRSPMYINRLSKRATGCPTNRLSECYSLIVRFCRNCKICWYSLYILLSHTSQLYGCW